MLIAAAILAVVAAAVAFYFFMLESLRWTEPDTVAIFQLRGAGTPAATAQLAYNLGFYNLFLAVGAGLGVVLLVAGNPVAGLTLMTFTTACMLLASVVLALSDRRLGRLSLIQGGPAAFSLVFSLLGT
ncbi:MULTISPECIES: DUF1304 domain-containing protein [unclassified Arthrobacter]|uniref:DUF1304 domain-containing protein n=1 Tax=unclassified Arthrobacter TaxID=235627 RepID=UPI001D15B8C7|nr:MULTISPECIES: DUF1304 domain-containing protein [unclassified Arthrobacter]MCC3278597.1 DUF1304 domain-containing protein [Arthrobacter sp. zg-Y40]MCC9176964.1 DUF1304 domain-containing protein [Arthrobacter sp. zg-Y750]MCC3275523.1 DUF1304 domain-containing protein [Arthrobacter sp. zg-Y20]MDK1315680.1 DUF1304 domain-containing protein [Arthrobacter sp. zg.Y20]MDK1326324.1 DUF1304 domain-containing protein [Arthrobacter sp. zg-Y1143]